MWSFAFQLIEQLLFLFWTDTYKNAQDQSNDEINHHLEKTAEAWTL